MGKIKEYIIMTISFLILATCFLGCLLTSTNPNSFSPPKKDNTYLIQNYNITININENNTYDVREEITAKFLAHNKHGIYRKIPLLHEHNINENGKTKYVAQKVELSNAKVEQGNLHSTEKKETIFYFVLGFPDKVYKVNDIDTYIISYTLNLGDDYANTFDQVYFNIINQWSCKVQNATFTVNLPKSFDASKLEMYTGKFGSTDKFTNYTITGNTITGSAENLNNFQGITMMLPLEQGYFTNVKAEKHPISVIVLISIILSIVVIILCFLLRNKHGMVIETVQFYPDKGDNPIKTKGKYCQAINSTDMISIIVYLASKKHLLIKTEIGNDKDLILIKKSHREDLSSEDSYVKLVFDLLFENGNNVKVYSSKFKEMIAKFNTPDTTDYDSVPEIFGEELLKESLELTKKFKKKYQDKKNKKLCVFGLISALLTGLLFCIATVMSYANAETFLVLLFFFTMLTIGSFNLRSRLIKIDKLGKFLLISMIVICTVALDYVMFKVNNFTYFHGYINFIAMIIPILIIASQLIPILNKDGVEVRGRALGFKHFIKTSEKEKLNALVNENPDYFFDILPYAYVFGISKKFIKKLETLDFNADQYFGMSFTSLYAINNAMSHSMSKTINSTGGPNSTFGGSSSSSGGGFSGGGFGGGSGGSW